VETTHIARSRVQDIVWPPQTTQDVINLTPRKNKHAYSMANPPTSPSPLRKSTGPPKLNGGPSDDDGESTDEEDEEVLKLKLMRIEAKLKLKKLQKQQQKKKAAEAAEKKPEAAIEVPASPAAARVAAVAQAPPSPKSPSRVLLGIDRGLTGKDVSLRRAPQYRKQPAQTPRAPSPPRPAKTFSQRLAEERAREKAKFEKQKTLAQSRSKGFGLKDEGVPTSAAQRATNSFTEVLTKYDRTQTVPPPPQATSQSFSAAFSSFARPTSRGVGSSGRDTTSRESSLETLPLRPSSAPAAPPAPESTDEAGFDSFSGLHLLRRTTPHPTVTRHLSQKTIFQLPQLLKTVVSPKYDPPEVEGDWVVVGTICSKSDPRNVGQNTGAKGTGKKYMVMQLTDLKWEIELFLFGAGFDRFWKVPVGTVVALLNPGVMKPRNQDSGRFSLTIADNADDCILEIGLARDLGFCRSMKRDGKQCGTWIDKRHTAFCAFHVEQTVKKAKVSRAEVNSMTSLFSPPKKNGAVKPRKFLGGRHGRAQSRDDGLLQEGPIADLPQRLGGAGGNIFVAPGRSTAALLDDEDYLASNFRLAGGTKEERLHRRLEEGKRERELTKRIIEAQGREGGLGTQYLRTRLGEADKERAENHATHQRKQVSFLLSTV
jgi:minichromosome maintenance protein 10